MNFVIISQNVHFLSVIKLPFLNTLIKLIFSITGPPNNFTPARFIHIIQLLIKGSEI